MSRSRNKLGTYAFLAFCLGSLGLDAAEGSVPSEIIQDFAKDGALEITGETAGITRIKQTGKPKRYDPDCLAKGVHFRTGRTSELNARIEPGNYQSGGLIGVHGAGSHILFKGFWRGDEGGSYPVLVLTEGGKMTWTAESHVDFVMDPSFFTRQIWVWGDGTGSLELAEGFVSDRTHGATVADAMGTIRLGGVDLITHHSQSLPYNNRPDGRGGIYHNGHVVFEHRPGSTWHVKTNPHIYAAQVDFAIDGTINCEAPLTHNGWRRDCLAVGNGGVFMSTGAFRTTASDVTITKTGPAMLSLEGQQGYRSGSTLVVAEGLLRFYTDPGAGDRYDPEAGVELAVVVKSGAKLLLGASTIRLKRLHLEAGATCWLSKGTTLVCEDQQIDEGAKWIDDAEVARKAAEARAEAKAAKAAEKARRAAEKAAKSKQAK